MRRGARLPTMGMALVWALAAAARAQLPAARLDALFPAGAAPGTSVDVTIHGADLDDPTGLLFSHPGITARVKLAEQGPFDQTPEPLPDTFVVTVAADVPPGHHAVRFQGRYGLSGDRTFVVDPSPHVAETEPNDTPADAVALPVPGVADGRFTGGADTDRYRFAGRRGVRLSIEALARRIDSRAGPVLRLTGPDGGLVDEARPVGAADPVLDVELPADGDYLLSVTDALHGNGPDHPYEIRISSAPRLAFVFPPVVAPGTTVDAVAYGWNLPGGRPSALTRDGRRLEEAPVRLAMPADIADRLLFRERLEPGQFALDGVAFRLEGPAGPSNALFVAAADGPTEREAADNDRPGAAQPLSLPAEIVGRFHPRHDVDWYRFDAKKGDVLWIEVWSRRLGLPTDPSLVIEREARADDGTITVSTVATVDDAGTRRGGREFDERSFDPSYRFTAPADGTYRLLVRDGHARLHDDPALAYRLVVRPPRPDFRLVAVPVDATGAVLLRKGGRAAVEVLADRRDGFAGDITVAARGLPAGVTAGEVVIGSGNTMTCLVLSAEEGAPPGGAALGVVGRATIPAGEIVRTARLGTSLDPLPFVPPGSQTASTRARLVETLPVTVSADEIAPVALSIGSGTVLETARGGVLKIPYSVTRREGAGASMTGVPIGLPPEVNPTQVAIGGGTAGEFEVRILAKTPPGTYSFHLAAMQQGLSYARNPAAAAAAKARAEAFAAVLADAQAKAQAAEEGARQAAAGLTAANAGADQAAKEAATEAKRRADQALADARERVRLAQAEKQRRDQQAAQSQQGSAPKGVNVVVPSAPVTVRIAEHPLRVTALPAALSGTQGTTLEIPFTIERLFGFTGDLQARVAPPAGVAGIPETTFTLPAAATAGTIMVPLAPGATPGTHELTLSLTLTFNGQQLVLPASLQATVIAADAAAGR